MLKLESQLTVDGLSGQDVTEFLLNPRDDRYQAWWPGTHNEFHVRSRGPGDSHVGDVIVMDEVIGARRVRMAAQVVKVAPGEEVVWQMRRWGVPLPVRLSVELRTSAHGVLVRHTIAAGCSGLARILDPLWRLYFTQSFSRAMDRHVHTEFPLLRDLLQREGDRVPARTTEDKR